MIIYKGLAPVVFVYSGKCETKSGRCYLRMKCSMADTRSMMENMDAINNVIVAATVIYITSLSISVFYKYKKPVHYCGI